MPPRRVLALALSALWATPPGVAGAVEAPAAAPPAAPATTPPVSTPPPASVAPKADTSGAEADALRLIRAQGRFWQRHGNGARAAEVWSRLLSHDAQDLEALYGVGLVEAEAGRAAAARTYLERIRALSPRSFYLARLEQAIWLYGADAKLIAQAKSRASNHSMVEALAIYDRLLAGRTPQGELALDYYLTMGYIQARMEAARQGLRRLHAEEPGNDNVTYALAELLTREESTRVEGIHLLETLSTHGGIGGAAKETWRGTLMWLNPRTAVNAALFQTYLRRYPTDEQVQNYRRRWPDVAPYNGQGGGAWQFKRVENPCKPGFDALDAGKNAEAERIFREVLAKRPNLADALGGLGVIALRRKDFPTAIDLLAQAARRGSRWSKALRTARYLERVDRAVGALRAGRRAEAREGFLAAMTLDPAPATAETQLALLDWEDGDLERAETRLRRAWKRRPTDPGTVRALVELLATDGRGVEAESVLERSKTETWPDKADVARAKAALALGRARATARTDAAAAERLLAEAQAQDPGNVWIRLELAKLAMARPDPAAARRILEPLLRDEAAGRDAHFALAIVEAQGEAWDAAIALLEAVPDADRSADMQALYRKALVGRTVRAGVEQGRRGGDRRGGVARIETAEEMAQGDPDCLALVAEGYVRLSAYARADAVLSGIVGPGREPRAAVLLLYAGVLLRMERDAEAAAIIQAVEVRTLTLDETRFLTLLQDLVTTRRAEALREAGDLEAAYALLAPILKARPERTFAWGAVARLYCAAGDHAQARDIQRYVAAREPDRPEAWLGLAQEQVHLDERDAAVASLDASERLVPDDPQQLVLAAGLLRALHLDERAERLLRRAAEMEARDAEPLLPGPPGEDEAGRAARADNPFAGFRGPGERPEAPAAPNPSAANAPASPALASAPASATGRAPTPPRLLAPGRADAASAPPGDVAEAPRLPGTAPAPAPPSSARAALAALEAERSERLRAGVDVRHRDGAPGTSELLDVEAPIELRVPFHDDTLTLRATPVMISAGRPGPSLSTATYFGGGPVVVQAAGATGGLKRNEQADLGVGLGVGFDLGAMGFDVGVTPLGFRFTDFTGGLRLSDTLDDDATLAYALKVTRRPVTDSLLSFAGAKDDRDGQDRTWGGVSATGANLRLDKSLGGAGLFAAGGWHRVTGHGVVDNSRSSALAGGYYHLSERADARLTMGLIADGLFFDRNLGHFTYGHGGYFSPQRALALRVPVSYDARGRRYAYRLSGALGPQYIHRDAAPFFPDSAALQSQAQEALTTLSADGQSVPARARYSSVTVTDLGYGLMAAGETRLVPQVGLGAFFSTSNGTSYAELRGGLYLVYHAVAQSAEPAFPVAPFGTPYSE